MQLYVVIYGAVAGEEEPFHLFQSRTELPRLLRAKEM